MNRQLTIFYILIFGFLSGSVAKLNGQNRWTGYFSYNKCSQIEETENFIAGATELGLILFHKNTQSISVKNRINGLSDSGISAIKAIEGSNTILIGYENGNIDVFKNGEIQNIPDLKIETLNANKEINHFLVHEEMVFCSTGFGILKIDIERSEIASTLIIGDEASFLNVHSTFIDDTFIYAATSSGVLRADLNSTLAFYENWELISDDNQEYCALAESANGILGVRGTKGGAVSVIRITETDDTPLRSFGRFENIHWDGRQYILTTRTQIHFLDSSFSITRSLDSVQTSEYDEPYQPSFRDARSTLSGNLAFADWNGGLFYETGGNSFQQILPSGPYSNEVFKAAHIEDELWVVPGGFGLFSGNAGIPPFVSILKDNSWIYFTRSNTEFFTSEIRDLINIQENPQDPDNVFVASWGNGLFEFDKNEEGDIYLKEHYLEDNSQLHNSRNTPAGRYVRTWGMAFDDNGNLYITNGEYVDPIVVYNVNDNLWYSYSYGILTSDYNKVGQLIIDNSGNKWCYTMRGPAKGIWVFDDKGTIENQSDDRYRGAIAPEDDSDSRNVGQLLLWDGNGEPLTNNIFSLAKDKNGYIWIGTDMGVLVQYNPENIFNMDKPAFIRIKVPRNDGSGLADYLLENQRVTSIAIDGANRKYFGTEGSGLYLISEDGTKTVNHFTTANSPLPSDNIRDIEIDKESGEIYISTAAGLISYQGDATAGNQAFSDVYVYPNPVRPEYEGAINITGLINRTNVKITDTAGNLVYETISLGGKALWNGKNLYGEDVKPGIYIVFLSSPDGSQTSQTKIAFIR